MVLAGVILIRMVVISGAVDYMEGLQMVMVGEQVAQYLFSLTWYSFKTFGGFRSLCSGRIGTPGKSIYGGKPV